MANYQFMLVVSVEASSYDEAMGKAQAIARKAGAELAAEDGTDNEGQRVYYLHPEGMDSDYVPDEE